MIQVANVAELMEEYTVLLARVLQHLFHDAPFPRRDRPQWILVGSFGIVGSRQRLVETHVMLMYLVPVHLP
ncbi:hypothetical protein QYF36_015059 [Acer negundo]|nr:hypothetical protein QYF36_015059 [Acer negundo]